MAMFLLGTDLFKFTPAVHPFLLLSFQSFDCFLQTGDFLTFSLVPARQRFQGLQRRYNLNEYPIHTRIRLVKELQLI